MEDKWRKEKQPSMKRRCTQHDYRERGIYMLTMAIEGRRPLLGKLTGDAKQASVELSPLGQRVRECWFGIPLHYPSIEVMRLCIMPDHIHGVLFAHERLEKHLGQVVSGFKAGCNKAARERGLLTTAAMPPSTEPVTTTAADTKREDSGPKRQDNGPKRRDSTQDNHIFFIQRCTNKQLYYFI